MNGAILLVQAYSAGGNTCIRVPSVKKKKKTANLTG
jgi:hypothetical protein